MVVVFRGSQQVGQEFFFLHAEGTLVMKERSGEAIHHFWGDGRQCGTSKGGSRRQQSSKARGYSQSSKKDFAK